MSDQTCGAIYPGGGWDLRCRLDAGHAGAHRGDWGWQWGQKCPGHAGCSECGREKALHIIEEWTSKEEEQ